MAINPPQGGLGSLGQNVYISQPGAIYPTSSSQRFPFAVCGACMSTPCRCIPPTTDSTELIKKELKVWIHFCYEFVKRNEGWIVVPDSSRPFDAVYLDNPNKRLKLIDKFPMNEIEICGLTIDQYGVLFPEDRPGALFRVHLIPYPTFQYWALGIEELPELLR